MRATSSAARPRRPPCRGAGRARGAARSRVPRVLVVDDQFTVRELQRTILAGAGYDVLTARDGREALELLDHGDGLDLVLTDIEMPSSTGSHCCRLCARTRATSPCPS